METEFAYTIETLKIEIYKLKEEMRRREVDNLKYMWRINRLNDAITLLEDT